MLDTMKLLGSNKSKITKDKNGENMSNYQQDSRVLHTFIYYIHLFIYVYISPRNGIF